MHIHICSKNNYDIRTLSRAAPEIILRFTLTSRAALEENLFCISSLQITQRMNQQRRIYNLYLQYLACQRVFTETVTKQLRMRIQICS